MKTPYKPICYVCRQPINLVPLSQIKVWKATAKDTIDLIQNTFKDLYICETCLSQHKNAPADDQKE
jgi:hypothetical protein